MVRARTLGSCHIIADNNRCTFGIRAALPQHFPLFKGNARTVGLHRFVVRQNVTLGLLIQHIDIVVSKIDDPHPAAGRINDYRGG